ncbi:MAG TPA: LamG-like jellyroll fold domain-containing protein, partial [Verrucomicrobiae bacterium]|nr:LamG-like jellyroll fold domain-containing protein [Verrucomicrobiae bacterium]
MKYSRTLLLGLLLVQFSPPARAAITNGLVGHWTFDATNGVTVADSSGFADDGTYFNLDGADPQWVTGKIGNALTFRGQSNGGDYVMVPSYPAPTNTYTVSAWVNFATQTTWPRSAIVENGLADGSGPIGLVVTVKNVDQQFGPLGTALRDDGGSISENDSVGFPTGVWQHVGVVADGSQVRLYRNGVQVAVTNYSGVLPVASLPALGIGIILDDVTGGTTGYFQGLIDDIGIWTNALSPAQMISIFNAGNAGKDLTAADSYQNIPVSFTASPTNFTRYVGEAVTFSVVAAGTPPFSYQWRQNGQPVPGATNSSFAIANVTLAQNTNQFSVTVSNLLSGATSAAGTLTVLPVDFNAGLIGYWNFDETTGQVAIDSTTNADNVTLSNYPDDTSPWAQGKIRGALQFGGTDTTQYGSVATYPKPASTMTMAMWVNVISPAAWTTFAKNWGDASSGQFHFGLFSDALHEDIYIKQGDGKTPTVIDTDPFPTNSWQHVAFVCDGAMVRMYRNGAQVGTPVAYSGTLALPPMQCIGFGAKLADSCETPGSSATGYLAGALDDVGLWARGLTPQEIFGLYAAGQAGKATLEAGPFVPAAPVIVQQPAGATVFEQKRVDLSVSVAGALPITYQWYKNGQALAGATSASLTFAQAGATNSGAYKVVASNSLGTATSSEVTVTVNQRPFATLVSLWSFENNLNDSSTNGNNGTAAGTVTYVPGKAGTAVKLAPANPVINSSANNLPLHGTDSWSINLWVNLPQKPVDLSYIAGFGPVLDTGGGTARAFLNFQGGIYEWGNSSDLASGVPYPLNT